ncbi:hypothetical protein, partial [Streptomyces rubellomurinus]|uniref:hypothetical protein n=1 Tax=Streptomyces rubellomurinus (strain ATCC 31215) TaxID=359131 RepID=UPI001ABFF292
DVPHPDVPHPDVPDAHLAVADLARAHLAVADREHHLALGEFEHVRRRPGPDQPPPERPPHRWRR